MKINTLFSIVLFKILIALTAVSLSGCFGGRGSNPYSEVDAKVEDNTKNLMSLAVGMTKGQVYELVGIANIVEGYDWGSVWKYKTRKGGGQGTLADKSVDQTYTPVVFDNTDRVIGYGDKFYVQTLSDLGAGQF